jgi:hypothetical protein
VEEKKADYLFTVKGNQKTLLSDVEDHFRLDSFFPQHRTIDKGHGRIEEGRSDKKGEGKSREVIGTQSWALGER